MNARSTLPALVLLSVLVGAVALAGGLAAGTATAQTANASADVTFDDQVGVEEVTVSEVTLPEGGFVAVYNSSGGLVGNSAYLEAGTHENVTVSISPALSRSQVVVAQAHRNEGPESFNASADLAYTNENGQAIADTAYVASEEFTRTTETATETATATASTTEADAATTSDDGGATATDSATETSGPGFTALAALVALVGAALLARR
ncbi:DUF7282 domain-containing protein [Halobaculum rubrum]|uniref:DUF7282 domain-containing protein n=1 Tax=Halobaculum rubrum TaxID=2872158 RepID=UPI001CA45605|nr:PGF-CTERM sorting domain-containing protein [Halobaculum rubrum]QZX98545.1 PGF-CTERM sorting domain-containing protein [Halobaculum rubrum]